MGAGGSNFIHNAYDFYQKPEVQIPLQTAKIIYNVHKIYELTTKTSCSCCGKFYERYDGDDYLCPKCSSDYY